MADRWMQGARQRMKEKGTVGSFTRKAKRAGMSTGAYAKKEYHAPGKLGKEARFAFTHGKKGKTLGNGR